MPGSTTGVLPSPRKRAGLSPATPPLGGVAEPLGCLSRVQVGRRRVGTLFQCAYEVRLAHRNGELGTVWQRGEERDDVSKRRVHHHFSHWCERLA
jgi:hypothetical protein